MNMQLCWLYLLFLMFTEDWFWHVLTHSQMAWRLTFDGCLLTSCPEASASKQFCLAEHTEIGCAKRYCVFYFGVLLAGALCAHHSCCRVPTFFLLCEKMRMKNTRKSIHSSPNMSKLKNISSSYCWAELTYNSVTLNSLGNIVVSLLKLLRS